MYIYAHSRGSRQSAYPSRAADGGGYVEAHVVVFLAHRRDYGQQTGASSTHGHSVVGAHTFIFLARSLEIELGNISNSVL